MVTKETQSELDTLRDNARITREWAENWKKEIRDTKLAGVPVHPYDMACAKRAIRSASRHKRILARAEEQRMREG